MVISGDTGFYPPHYNDAVGLKWSKSMVAVKVPYLTM